MNYIKRLALAFDILINTLFGGDVETISSNFGRKIKNGHRCLVCKVVCGLLNLRWSDHCINNIMTPLNKP